MSYKMLDRVVLERDVVEHGLRSGDLGVVVETYPTHGLEVEFMTASGDTIAVVTLNEEDVRIAREDEMLTVRPLAARG